MILFSSPQFTNSNVHFTKEMGHIGSSPFLVCPHFNTEHIRQWGARVKIHTLRVQGRKMEQKYTIGLYVRNIILGSALIN